ncbi:MAG: dTMP kinase [Epsilonproteobacteria bacterium]|nr:dTMP kinase [Campylobacterota bacterium]
MYILLEGIDGTGKSTQLELIRERFPDIITTKEPAGTEVGVEIREMLLNGRELSKEAETLLFLADRAEHYNRVIAPNRGKVIISDRGFISGIAYSLANGDCDIETLKLLNSFALQNSFPDLIFLFKLDEKRLRERLNRGLDNIEKRGFEYLLEVQRYMEIAIEYFNIPHIKIDASLGVETIHDIIVEQLNLITKIVKE